jgi:hypothetical protein
MLRKLHDIATIEMISFLFIYGGWSGTKSAITAAIYWSMRVAPALDDR